MRRILLLGLLASVPVTAMAQSSQFGVRGLGQPGRSMSARAVSSGGAFGLFDSESSLNPASLDGVGSATAVFTGVQTFRSVENPAGSESLRESRFPLLLFAGPIQRFPMAFGLSYSSYTGRDFTLATVDTLELRGAPVEVFDTLSSRGGINDLRLAASYRLAPGWSVGGGFHVLTGSNRAEFQRGFGDPAYLPVSEEAELSFAGIGWSLGTIRQFGPRLGVAAVVRADRYVGVDRDSTRVATIDLPYTLGLGVRYQLTSRLQLGTQGIFRSWSGANSDLQLEGAPGAENTVEVSFGGQYVGDPRRPFRRPIRFGARYARLPFPLSSGLQPDEFGVSLGSGTRFAQERAGIDLAVEHVWRSAGEFKERVFLVTVGVSVRP